MARSKKNRPSVQSPAPGSELAHLHLLFIRADYLRQIWSEAAKDARKTDSPDPLSLEGGYGVPIWASVTLFLASLHTVVEGWRRLQLSDPQVDLILSDTQKADRLRALRDGVFHYGAIDNPSVMGVVGDREMLAWAAKLLSAFRTFMRDRPKEPRAA
jgi:hypothetical protein